MNSESMWSSHIAGKRHIKNAIKYPAGLPKRGLDEEDSYDDSYDKPAKHIKSDNVPIWNDDYPPPEYMDDYYYENPYYNNEPPMDYEPLVKPNVVFDYGHTKKLEDTVPPPLAPPPKPPIREEDLGHRYPPPAPAPASAPAPAPVAAPVPAPAPAPPKILSFDKILQDLAKSAQADKQAQENDDFFAKLNQREIAKDIAKEIAKKCFYQNENKTDEEPKKKPTVNVYEKYDKKKSSDIFDILHKHNEKKLFEMAEKRTEKSEESTSFKKSSKKSKSKLDDFDPDDLSTDVLDDLLSAKLKPKKKNVPLMTNELELRKAIMKTEVNLDDPKVLAEKLEKLPTMLFLQLVHKKLLNLDLQSSDELKMLLKIVSEAQVVCCKKLPPNLQALVKTPLSEIGKAPIQKTVTPENQCVKPSVSSTIENAAVPRSSTVSTAASQVKNTPASVIPPVVHKPLASPVAVSSSPSQTVTSISAPVQSVAVSKSSANITAPPPPPPPPIAARLPNPVFSIPPPSVINPAALMYQMQASVAVNQPPAFSGAPSVYPAAWQNCQSNAIYNHYYSLFSMYKNAQMNQPNASVHQQRSTLYRQPLPLSKEKITEMNKLQLQTQQSKEKSVTKPPENVGPPKIVTKEMLEAIKKLQEMRKLQSQAQQSKEVSNKEKSVTKPPENAGAPKEMLEALKNLQSLADEYKKSASGKNAK